MYKGKKGKKGQKARTMGDGDQFGHMMTPRNEHMEKVDEEAQDEANMVG